MSLSHNEFLARTYRTRYGCAYRILSSFTAAKLLTAAPRLFLLTATARPELFRLN